MRGATTLTVIGCGAMGSALLQGFLQQNFFSHIHIVTPRSDSAKTFENNTCISWQSSNDPLPVTDVYLLAVKPALIKDTLKRLAPILTEKSLIISVAAGLSLAFYQKNLPPLTAILRLMPNTPSRIGQGIVLAIGTNIEAYQNTLTKLLSSLGHVKWVDNEHTFDKLATLTACGPAFVYYFMECLSKATHQLGIDDPDIDVLTHKLLTGSLAYLTHQNTSPIALREEVTSPNGTTEAGLGVLMNEEALKTMLTAMLQASMQRTRDIQHAA